MSEMWIAWFLPVAVAFLPVVAATVVSLHTAGAASYARVRATLRAGLRVAALAAPRVEI